MLVVHSPNREDTMNNNKNIVPAIYIKIKSCEKQILLAQGFKKIDNEHLWKEVLGKKMD